MKNVIASLFVCLLWTMGACDSDPSPIHDEGVDAANTTNVSQEVSSTPWVPPSYWTDPPACYTPCGDWLCWTCGDTPGMEGVFWEEDDNLDWLPPYLEQPRSSDPTFCDSDTVADEMPDDLYQCEFLEWEATGECVSDYCSAGNYARTGEEFYWLWKVAVCSNGWSCVTASPEYRVRQGVCAPDGCFAPPPPPSPPPGGGGVVMPPGNGGPCRNCPVEQGVPL